MFKSLWKQTFILDQNTSVVERARRRTTKETRAGRCCIMMKKFDFLDDIRNKTSDETLLPEGFCTQGTPVLILYEDVTSAFYHCWLFSLHKHHNMKISMCFAFLDKKCCQALKLCQFKTMTHCPTQ